MYDSYALLELAEEARDLEGKDDPVAQHIRSSNLRLLQDYGLSVEQLLDKPSDHQLVAQ